MLRACLIAGALGAAIAATIHSKQQKRTYNTAGKIVPGAINVHLVPHR